LTIKPFSDTFGLISKKNVYFSYTLRRDMQIVFQYSYGSLSPRMTCKHIIAEGLSDPVFDAPQTGHTRELMAAAFGQVAKSA